MFLFGPFALRSTPFHWLRFSLYMAGLAALTAGSFAIGRNAPAAEKLAVVAHDAPAPAPAGADSVETVRLCMSEEDLLGDLPRLGIPWFLRRQGATARFESRGETEIAIEVSYQGKTAGDYVERLTALDTERTRIQIEFVPKDMDLLTQLAKPIDTSLDPASLMRVVMAEHVRSNMTGAPFDFNVLSEKSVPSVSTFGKAFVAIANGPRQNGDDIVCPNASHNANIRRAYREEAQKAGAHADKL
jgi:hypothetical protein